MIFEIPPRPGEGRKMDKILRAREILSNFLPSPRLQGIPKITLFSTQIPRWSDITITYYLLYKSYVFMVPKPPKYRYFGTPKPLKLGCLASRQPKIPLSSPKTAAERPSWCPEARCQGAKTPAKQPSWCQDIKIPPRARPFALTGWFPNV